MNKTRESCLASILARGLIRVRQRAERTGYRNPPGNSQPQPTAAGESPDGQTPVVRAATANEEGEQQ
jgi:hypothetical protein